MPQVRDLFFDEFYAELERVVSGIARREEDARAPPVLSEEARRRWRPYMPNAEERDEVLISVDGGVQVSHFAYGDVVAVGRACALVHWQGRDRMIEKRVKIYVEKVYDNRDRGFIPGYVRMISEYDVAQAAAENVLEEGGKPIVLLDGSLYLSRFPYAIREYRHHPELLAEMFNSLSSLRYLGRDQGFPVVAVSKDSTVFYLYMELLKDAVKRAGLGRLTSLIEDASSPLDLRIKMEKWDLGDREAMEPFIETRPLCDTALIRTSTDVEGYTQPLLLAPSIYYRREAAPSLYNRIQRNLSKERADNVVNALKQFFSCPGVAVTYWKPNMKGRPFRVDLSAAALGYHEPWGRKRGNTFVEEDRDLRPLERVLNHLGYWFCNDVEYNVPLKQADMLARFDRNLYRRKYEPFIVSRLKAAGYDVTGTRRMQREMD